MRKILLVNDEVCAGCRICEIYCSLVKTKTCNPARARVGVLQKEEEGRSFPMVCHQCENPPCMGACPVEAMSKDTESGVVSINPETCIGCRACLEACPFGAIAMDPVDNTVFKCDLCQGDPWCARMCPTGAISFTTADKVTLARRLEALEKVTDQMKAALEKTGGS